MGGERQEFIPSCALSTSVHASPVRETLFLPFLFLKLSRVRAGADRRPRRPGARVWENQRDRGARGSRASSLCSAGSVMLLQG